MSFWVTPEVSGTYAAYRPSFPKPLAEWIVGLTALTPRALAVDVGCGSAAFAADCLAPVFEKVVAVDP